MSSIRDADAILGHIIDVVIARRRCAACGDQTAVQTLDAADQAFELEPTTCPRCAATPPSSCPADRSSPVPHHALAVRACRHRPSARRDRVEVPDRVWSTFLDEYTPIPAQKGRSRTIAEKTRAELERLWSHDQRVAPWKGTAFGVHQATNTYLHHYATVRNVGRAERNMDNVLSTKLGEVETATQRALNKALGKTAGNASDRASDRTLTRL